MPTTLPQAGEVESETAAILEMEGVRCSPFDQVWTLHTPSATLRRDTSVLLPLLTRTCSTASQPHLGESGRSTRRGGRTSGLINMDLNMVTGGQGRTMTRVSLVWLLDMRPHSPQSSSHFEPGVTDDMAHPCIHQGMIMSTSPSSLFSPLNLPLLLLSYRPRP